MFWTFDSTILSPPNPNPDDIPDPEIVETPSDTGDDCHRNIHFVSNSRAKKIFYDNASPPEEKLVVCNDGEPQNFDWHALKDIVEHIDGNPL